MLRIGLTGGIAAGKSVVTERLGRLGAVVVDGDLLARAAVEPGSDGLGDVVAAFGRGFLGPDGALDRPALGRLVFADSTARERLNAIIHPRVRTAAAHVIGQAPEGAVVVEDMPLLVETGQAARFHLVVVVDAPHDVRIERMASRRGLQRSDAEQRIAAQASREERLRAADAILVNDRGLGDLLAAADALWHERIVPFRDNLGAGRPATAPRASSSGRAGLAGTSALSRRVRAKLEAVLPAGVSVHPAGSSSGRSTDDDDVRRAVVSVSLTHAWEVPTVSDAVTEAGFPRVADADDLGRAEGPAVHRAADPAVDVTVLVAAGGPSA